MPRSIFGHLVLASLLCATTALAQETLTGAKAFGTWERDAPGVSRHIKPADLPPPTLAENDPEAPDFENMAKVVEAPQGKMPEVPKGFAVQVFAKGLNKPRVIRTAPNGDIFVAESGSGRVLVFPGGAPRDGAGDARSLRRGPGPALRHRVPSAERPRHVYVAAANQVVRYPYRGGDRKATGPAQVIITDIPPNGIGRATWQSSRDGRRLFVSIGSASNVAAKMPEKRRRTFRPTRRRTGLARPGARRRTGPWCACSIRKARPSATSRPACATAPA